jgi:hypothetical protein
MIRKFLMAPVSRTRVEGLIVYALAGVGLGDLIEIGLRALGVL